MPSAIKAANIQATGTLVATPCSLRHVHVRSGATAGVATFRDGGGSGTVKLIIDTPASAAALIIVPIPAPGLQFDTDCHVTLSVADRVTAIFT